MFWRVAQHTKELSHTLVILSIVREIHKNRAQHVGGYCTIRSIGLASAFAEKRNHVAAIETRENLTGDNLLFVPRPRRTVAVICFPRVLRSQDAEDEVGLPQPLLHEKSGTRPSSHEPLVQLGLQAILL